MNKALNDFFSMKNICLVLIAATICFSCSRNSVVTPNNDIEDGSGTPTVISEPNNDSIPRIVIESDTSSYHFENQEYYFCAYYDDLRSPPFKFSFFDGIFYMDIPELDLLKIELGEPIKGNIQGQYIIIEENGFVYIIVAEKKFLVLYNESLVCVLIDSQNNDAFFGLNKNSVYVDVPQNRGPFVGITVQASRNPRVSSFLTETLRGSNVSYDGSNEKYGYELTKPWIEGNDGHGIGEWLETEPTANVCGIVFFNGYIDPNRPDLFYANSRIKEVLVSSEKGTWIFEIQDTPHPQILPLPDSFNAVLRFTIMDVYEGTKYSDTCLAGIYFLRIRYQ